MYILSAFAWALIFSGENAPISGPSKKELQLASWRAKPKSSEGSVCAHAASGRPGSPPRLLPAQEPVFVLHLYLGLKECTFKLSHPWVFSDYVFQFILKISEVGYILHRNVLSQSWHQISLRCQRVRETAGIPTLSRSWQMQVQSGICGRFYSFGTENHWTSDSSWAPAFTPFLSLKLLGS